MEASKQTLHYIRSCRGVNLVRRMVSEVPECYREEGVIGLGSDVVVPIVLY
jgi:hypothetical protein